MNKNLLERLRKLTAELAEARHDQNDELADSLEDEIYQLEFELSEEAEFEYADLHNRNWH